MDDDLDSDGPESNRRLVEEEQMHEAIIASLLEYTGQQPNSNSNT